MLTLHESIYELSIHPIDQRRSEVDNLGQEVQGSVMSNVSFSYSSLGALRRLQGYRGKQNAYARKPSNIFIIVSNPET